MTDEKPDILMDVDGCIANFCDSALEVCGIPLKQSQVSGWNFYEDYMTEEEFLNSIANHPDFWLNLSPYPWAHELVNSLREVGRVVFCSAPTPEPHCIEQKITWLRRYGFMAESGEGSRDFVFTPHKGLLGGSGAVLVDDADHNVDAYRKQGGRAVLFPRPWNKNRALDRHTNTNSTNTEYVITVVKGYLSELQRERDLDQDMRDIKATVREMEHQAKSESVLDEALRYHTERGKNYGHPADHFARTIGCFNAMFGQTHLKKPLEPHHWGMIMTADKLCRAIESPEHRDNHVDAAGYPNCTWKVVERLLLGNE